MLYNVLANILFTVKT